MTELTKRYPYFNEDAETNWSEGNLNQEMSNKMKDLITICQSNGQKLKVNKIDEFKVHDLKKTCMIWYGRDALPYVDCSRHSSAKPKDK